MIKIINGIIGGGKTSLAMCYIYSLMPNKVISKPIIKDSDYSGDYEKLYTNISGFVTDDFLNSVEFLNFEILDKCALVMYLLLDQNKHIKDIDIQMNSFFDQVAEGVIFENIESDLNIESAEVFYDEIVGFRFNRVLFAIDEFADYFQDKKPHLLKWFNWSRHLYQDMILIQNDIGEVAKAYKNDKVVKHYIKAVDPENRWHPSLFRYAFFRKSTQPQSGVDKFKNVWVPKWIFTKYESGMNHTAFPKIYKYLLGFLFLILLLAFLVNKVLHKGDEYTKPSEEITTETTRDHSAASPTSQPTVTSPPVASNTSHNRRTACFKCSNDICIYKNDIYSLQRMKSAMNTYDFKLAYSTDTSVYSEYCYFSNKSFFKQYEISNNRRKTTGINSLMVP